MSVIYTDSRELYHHEITPIKGRKNHFIHDLKLLHGMLHIKLRTSIIKKTKLVMVDVEQDHYASREGLIHYHLNLEGRDKSSNSAKIKEFLEAMLQKVCKVDITLEKWWPGKTECLLELSFEPGKYFKRDGFIKFSSDNGFLSVPGENYDKIRVDYYRREWIPEHIRAQVPKVPMYSINTEIGIPHFRVLRNSVTGLFEEYNPPKGFTF